MLSFELLVIFLLILLNGIFALSELAIVSAKKVHLKRLAEGGSIGARMALDFSENTGRFLPTVQVGITLIGVLSGAFSGASFSAPLTQYLIELGLGGETAEILAVSVVVVGVTYVTLIIGELVPKELALRNPERLAVFVSPIIYLLSRVTAPVVWLLNVSSQLVLRLIGAGHKPETTVTEEEVRSMIKEGTEFGLFHESERDMISGIMLLADKPIRAFMLPRIEVIAISRYATLDEVRNVFREHPYSRYPVFDGVWQNVLGILQAKELINHLLSDTPGIIDIPALTHKVTKFVDSTPTLTVIEYLRTSPIHMVVIVDDHGAFTGIVTLTDLVEVILGELNVRGEEVNTIVERDDGSQLMDGSILIEKAFEAIGIQSPPQEIDYHTLAGFVLHQMGVVPKAGDHFTYEGHRFEVMDMDGNRVDAVLVSQIPEEPGA